VETSRKAFTLQRVEIPACIGKEYILPTTCCTLWIAQNNNTGHADDERTISEITQKLEITVHLLC
jgi:hypothetical protein